MKEKKEARYTYIHKEYFVSMRLFCRFILSLFFVFVTFAVQGTGFCTLIMAGNDENASS